MKHILLTILFVLPIATLPLSGLGVGPEYEKEDSILIERLLLEAKKSRGDVERTLWFGQQLLGRPYVAHTLENGTEEHLIVNTRGLDCTTFVETVCALALCDQHGQTTFHDYCQWLQKLRYRQGQIVDYTSRLHYFTQWGEDNEQMGLVKNILDKVNYSGFATQTIRINYMSQHPDLYKHLKRNPHFVPVIRKLEDSLAARRYKYLPKSKLNAFQSELSFIHTGDIVAIITSKDGLDTSHLGFAVWQNGRLHLMHASSLYKRVVIDSKTFYDYSQGQRSQLGIRVFRLAQ
jgi:hypothetical protein